MALRLRTFSNTAGGETLFKALGHPAIAARARRLVASLSNRARIAVYDPDDCAGEFAQLYDLSSWRVVASFVQRAEKVGALILGLPAGLISALPACDADVLFVAKFDSGRHLQAIRQLVPPGLRVVTFDELRLDAAFGRRERYLDPLNFASNFAFFRDVDGQHTRLTTANHWARHGARDAFLWLCLFDESGESLARWTHPLPDSTATVEIDSAEVRARFGLGAFTGSLFLHAVGAEGHEVVKYALDLYGDSDEVLSCTHDANAWPAERYAGLPAPRDDERVLLWVQNSHPAPIPAGEVGLAAMGSGAVVRFDEAIPAFGTRAIDVSTLLPDRRWPDQIEIHAGRHFVRPRYEVVRSCGARRIAHANVERGDLQPDPAIARLGPEFGKGFILPAPILPLAEYRTTALPTPMATTQRELPIQVRVYDADGRLCARRPLGRVARDKSIALEIDDLLQPGRATLPSGYGHLELAYDFEAGTEADGWLHGLFRYESRSSAHAAETSFGAHLYNLPVVYRDEPQSYNGPAPGLSTRLYLRLGFGPRRTLCQLIYPASADWVDHSSTRLLLHDALGKEIAERSVRVPINGSLLWYYDEMFDPGEREAAGAGYVIVRDASCRLFGYHGLIGAGRGFSLDHMFGF